MKICELKFDLEDNLLRVFKLPKHISSEFCFNGGHPTNFQMIDWFRPSNTPAEPLDMDSIREFIRQKMYYSPECNYLVLCRTGETFLVDTPNAEVTIANDEF